MQKIKPNLSPEYVKEMLTSDNKPLAIHAFHSFYYDAKIVERQNSFEIGNTSIPKSDLAPLSHIPMFTKQNENEHLGKLISLLHKIHEFSQYKPETLKEHARHLIPLSKDLVETLKVHNYSYQSLLEQSLLSTRQTVAFEGKNVVHLDREGKVTSGPEL